MSATKSAYRKFYSTETAVTAIYNDVLLAADSSQVSALCLLDLTAAFDNVDHDLLFLCLEWQLCLRSVVLYWFQSYLSDRSFRVVYVNKTSSVIHTVCSVPQGSVLTWALISIKHVTTVSVACFYYLRQLRRVRRSLDANSTKTLEHAFVTSWVDYCNAVFARWPKYITDILRVLNAAARLVTCICKYDRGLSTLLHDQLHWLNVPERVEYKLAVVVCQCLENKAPRYLVECCTPVADVASGHRRSANLHRLTVPQCQRSTIGRRAFSVGAWRSFGLEFTACWTA